MIAGVAGGVAKYSDIDPVIVRIVAVVLIFFGGAGLLLYLAGVLLMPNEGDPATPGQPQQRNRALVILGVVGLVCLAGPFFFAPAFILGGLLFPLAGLILAVTYVGGQVAQTVVHVPSATAGIFQAMMLFFILASDILVRYRVRILRDAPRAAPAQAVA